jgi:hypothetical protein
MRHRLQSLHGPCWTCSPRSCRSRTLAGSYSRARLEEALARVSSKKVETSQCHLPQKPMLADLCVCGERKLVGVDEGSILAVSSGSLGQSQILSTPRTSQPPPFQPPRHYQRSPVFAAPLRHAAHPFRVCWHGHRAIFRGQRGLRCCDWLIDV